MGLPSLRAKIGVPTMHAKIGLWGSVACVQKWGWGLSSLGSGSGVLSRAAAASREIALLSSHHPRNNHYLHPHDYHYHHPRDNHLIIFAIIVICILAIIIIIISLSQ